MERAGSRRPSTLTGMRSSRVGESRPHPQCTFPQLALSWGFGVASDQRLRPRRNAEADARRDLVTRERDGEGKGIGTEHGKEPDEANCNCRVPEETAEVTFGPPDGAIRGSSVRRGMAREIAGRHASPGLSGVKEILHSRRNQQERRRWELPVAATSARPRPREPQSADLQVAGTRDAKTGRGAYTVGRRLSRGAGAAGEASDLGNDSSAGSHSCPGALLGQYPRPYFPPLGGVIDSGWASFLPDDAPPAGEWPPPRDARLAGSFHSRQDTCVARVEGKPASRLPVPRDDFTVQEIDGAPRTDSAPVGFQDRSCRTRHGQVSWARADRERGRRTSLWRKDRVEAMGPLRQEPSTGENVKRTTRNNARRSAGALRTLSAEELSLVSGGITAKMPPSVYGDATFGDMRLIPRTALMSK